MVRARLPWSLLNKYMQGICVVAPLLNIKPYTNLCHCFLSLSTLLCFWNENFYRKFSSLSKAIVTQLWLTSKRPFLSKMPKQFMSCAYPPLVHANGTLPLLSSYNLPRLAQSLRGYDSYVFFPQKTPLDEARRVVSWDFRPLWFRTKKPRNWCDLASINKIVLQVISMLNSRSSQRGIIVTAI